MNPAAPADVPRRISASENKVEPGPVNSIEQVSGFSQKEAKYRTIITSLLKANRELRISLGKKDAGSRGRGESSPFPQFPVIHHELDAANVNELYKSKMDELNQRRSKLFETNRKLRTNLISFRRLHYVATVQNQRMSSKLKRVSRARSIATPPPRRRRDILSTHGGVTSQQRATDEFRKDQQQLTVRIPILRLRLAGKSQKGRNRKQYEEILAKQATKKSRAQKQIIRDIEAQMFECRFCRQIFGRMHWLQRHVKEHLKK